LDVAGAAHLQRRHRQLQQPPHLPAGRRVEQSTYDSVPVRLLTADTHCAFRRDNQALLTESFVKVLPVAQQAEQLADRAGILAKLMGEDDRAPAGRSGAREEADAQGK
jgi:hypothetical protein